jgi:hypothetical protein
MNISKFLNERNHYYNEIAFHWPDEWEDVDSGLCAFHEKETLKHIHSVVAAERLSTKAIGQDLTARVFDLRKYARTPSGSRSEIVLERISKWKAL